MVSVAVSPESSEISSLKSDARINLLPPLLAFVVSRALLLSVNEAEFTDGYQLLTWSFDHPVRWHPLYPLCVKLLSWFLDPVIAGRLISIVSGFGAMLVIGKLAGHIYDQRRLVRIDVTRTSRPHRLSARASVIAMWLYIVAPLFYWANLRVLSESTFQFFFIWSIYQLLCYADSKRFSAPAFIFISGLAYLTRPEAIVLLPLVLYVLARSRGRLLLANIAALLPWAIGFFWTFGISSSDRYTDIVVTSLPAFDWNAALTRLVAYVEIYPYIAFYPFFALALINLFRIPARPIWRWILIYVHVSFAVILFMHPAWTTRLLLIPLSFLLIEVAAGLLPFRRNFQIALLASCVLFSMAALFLQRNQFSDFKNSALAVKDRISQERVVSDELAKTEFYLRRPIVVYQHKTLLPGDILILHSYNSDLEKEKEFLDRHFYYTPLYEAHSEVVPLLANTALAETAYTNSPVALLQRFQVQRFQSVVIRIDQKR